MNTMAVVWSISPVKLLPEIVAFIGLLSGDCAERLGLGRP